jgi:uncharacterized tellurite resistance protein B-like protein
MTDMFLLQAMIHTSTLDIVAQNQLNVLIHLAKADRDFAEVEREMICRISKEKNFPEDRLNRMMQEPMPIDSLGALSSNQKFQYLMDCIELVLVDNKIMESELIFCRSIAIKLGFKKGLIDFLIANKNSLNQKELHAIAFRDYIA